MRSTWIMAAGIAAALGVTASGPAAQAQVAQSQAEFPNRPVRLIVGFTPGSSADIAARVTGNRMTKVLGQQVVVENRPGAASSIAAEHVARAEKDGHTLFMMSSANINNQIINPALTFDVVKDFTPVALINNTAIVLAVHPDTGIKSVKELIERAKAKPGGLSYASSGVGTAPHMSGVLFADRAGIDILHVPYKGSPAAATDLLAGRVAMMFAPASTVVAHAKEGKLRLLATTTDQRLKILPGVPTMAEAGMPDFETSIWFGLVAPAGTPKAAVDKLAKAVAAATKAPEIAEAWAPQGIIPLHGGPEFFARHIASELKRWSAAAESAGLTKGK